MKEVLIFGVLWFAFCGLFAPQIDSFAGKALEYLPFPYPYCFVALPETWRFEKLLNSSFAKYGYSYENHTWSKDGFNYSYNETSLNQITVSNNQRPDVPLLAWGLCDERVVFNGRERVSFHDIGWKLENCLNVRVDLDAVCNDYDYNVFTPYKKDFYFPAEVTEEQIGAVFREKINAYQQEHKLLCHSALGIWYSSYNSYRLLRFY